MASADTAPRSIFVQPIRVFIGRRRQKFRRVSLYCKRAHSRSVYRNASRRERTLNIVFDLGGVVFDWQPDAIISSFFDDAGTQELVRKEIFQHPDWIELDRGTIPLPQAIDRGAARTGLPAGDIKRLLDAVPRFLIPIEATFELIRSLTGTGHKLYVLSNMHLASIVHLKANYDIWNLFDGIVFSCSVRMVKPERGIYEHLLKEHRLDPVDTIFIDDVAENLGVASSFGIRTIRFVDPDQCANALRATIAAVCE